jgi:hypothetical protein
MPCHAGWAHLSSSMPTRPVTSAVVVAIAGMIFPAICFVRYRSAGVMLTTHSTKLWQADW